MSTPDATRIEKTGRLGEWIGYVFDHPVVAPAWYFSEDAPEWSGPREEIPELIAETFERSGKLLPLFPDERLNEGFWFLVGDATPANFAQTLVDEGIPLTRRLRAVRSFVPLFEQVMAVRCTDHLGHLREKGANPLNSVCYMWWDLLRFRGLEQAGASLDVAMTFRRLLSIPHDACRESALHGIGHWVHSCPQLAAVVDEFLSATPDLRPALTEYAKWARIGKIP